MSMAAIVGSAADVLASGSWHHTRLKGFGFRVRTRVRVSEKEDSAITRASGCRCRECMGFSLGRGM